MAPSVYIKKIEKKFPSFCIEGSTCDPMEWEKYMKVLRRQDKFRHENPSAYHADLNNIVFAMDKFYQDMARHAIQNRKK
jgi:hypothetical protein